MPIYGSFAETASRHLAAIPAMMEATTRDSVDMIETLVKDATPIDTGELKASIRATPTTRTARGAYTASVESSLNYAAPVEFGSAPHRIEPRDAQALHFNGEFYAGVNHPGHAGAHMFRRGGIEFERAFARLIAVKNAKQFLGTS